MTIEECDTAVNQILEGCDPDAPIQTVTRLCLLARRIAAECEELRMTAEDSTGQRRRASHQLLAQDGVVHIVARGRNAVARCGATGPWTVFFREGDRVTCEECYRRQEAATGKPAATPEQALDAFFEAGLRPVVRDSRGRALS
jgi:hypothetical protein